MTETIEEEVKRRILAQIGKPGSHSPGSLPALALEQLITEHRATKAELEAFRREVSEELTAWFGSYCAEVPPQFARFIIPQTDPLVEAMSEAMCGVPGEDYTKPAKDLRAALAARGLKIVQSDD